MEHVLDKLSDQVKSNPNLCNKLEDIAFLGSKINYLRNQIQEANSKLVEKIVKETLDNSKKQLNKIKKNDTFALTLTTTIDNASGNDPFFFYLDTFIIDVRRYIEFFLRFSMTNLGLDDLNFKVQNFVNQIKPSCTNERSTFVNILSKNHKWFIDYLNEVEKWLKQINHFRTQSIHYEIFNQTGLFKIKFVWNSLKKIEDAPDYIKPNLPYFDMPVLEFTRYYIKNLDKFMEKSAILNLDIIEKAKKKKK